MSYQDGFGLMESIMLEVKDDGVYFDYVFKKIMCEPIYNWNYAPLAMPERN